MKINSILANLFKWCGLLVFFISLNSCFDEDPNKIEENDENGNVSVVANVEEKSDEIRSNVSCSEREPERKIEEPTDKKSPEDIFHLLYKKGPSQSDNTSVTKGISRQLNDTPRNSDTLEYKTSDESFRQATQPRKLNSCSPKVIPEYSTTSTKKEDIPVNIFKKYNIIGRKRKPSI